MNRNAVIKHIDQYKAKLGSYSAVARRCNVNVGTLSTIMRGKYGANEARMLQKIATALGFRENPNPIVRSLGNYKRLESVYNDAKSESMWFPISNKAGSGKTATFEDLFNLDESGSVIFIQAEEWTGKQFLTKLITQTMGDQVLQGIGYTSVMQLIDMVANFFNEMSLERPVLLIDEADKLKPGALRVLIPIYNRTENRLGVILSGTENLEKEIKNGVRLAKKGYDELDSRLGRNYITLQGATEKEVYEVCNAHGLYNEESQHRVWMELPKVHRIVMVRSSNGSKEAQVAFVEDFRLLMRRIKRELLMKKAA